MKCPKCGGRIQVNDRFCVLCGTPVNEKQMIKEVDKEAEVSAFDPVAEEAKSEISNRRFNKVIITGCIVAGLLAFLIFGTVFKAYSRSKGQTPAVNTEEEQKPKKPAGGPWDVNDNTLRVMLEDENECNLFDHFDVTYDELAASQMELFEVMGIGTTARETYLHMSDDHRYTAYKLSYTYRDDSYNNTISFDLDPKSGRLHSVNIHADSEDNCNKMFMSITAGMGIEETDAAADWETLMKNADHYIDTDRYSLYSSTLTSSCYAVIEANHSKGTSIARTASASGSVADIDEMLTHVVTDKYDRMFETSYEDFMTREGSSLKELGADLSEPEVTFSLFSDYSDYSNDNYFANITYGGRPYNCNIDIDYASGNIRNISVYGSDMDTNMAIIRCCLEGLGMQENDLEKNMEKLESTVNKMKNDDDESVDLATCIVDINYLSRTYYFNIRR